MRVTGVSLYSVPQAAVLDISESVLLDFGVFGPGAAPELEVSIANLGKDTLTVQSVGFTGADAARASITNVCTTLEFGENCTETLTLPFGSGELITDLALEVLSSDPGNPQQVVPITATISADNDSIPDAVEAAGPNGGDANNDGTADILQANVTSFPDVNNQYVVLEAEAGLVFRDVEAVENPSSVDLPVSSIGSLSFDHRFFSFTLENVPVGTAATVTLTFPEAQTVGTNYFKFGRPTTSANQDSWYLFDFNGVTGAQIEGNKITLHLVDGGAGDDDQEANGRIVDPGGPALLTVPGSSSGGGGCAVVNAKRLQVLYPVDLIVLLSGIVFFMVLRNCGMNKLCAQR